MIPRVNLSEETDTEGEETQSQAWSRKVSRSTLASLLRGGSRGWTRSSAELDRRVNDTRQGGRAAGYSGWRHRRRRVSSDQDSGGNRCIDRGKDAGNGGGSWWDDSGGN